MKNSKTLLEKLSDYLVPKGKVIMEDEFGRPYFKDATGIQMLSKKQVG